LLAATPFASAWDSLILKTTPPQKKEGEVVAVTGGKIVFKEGQAELSYAMDQVESVTKAPPPQFLQGSALVEAGNFEGALPLLKAVADKFKGLPTTWAQDATASLGNIYLSLNKLNEAASAIADFKTAYGGSGSLAGKVAEARLAAARKKYADARSIAAPLVADALTKKNVTRAESQLYGQAYFVLGQVAEGENKLPEAMENYCRTVAIFYQERSVVAEAQKRIDDLRQKGITTP
jgi:tetratricopeptide (TPR) repeat protein